MTASKIITPLQALDKAMKYCAYQERYHLEVEQKLREWGMNEEEAGTIVSELITRGFLNEERFARAFAGGKFRTKGWGRRKILQELKARRISNYCIQAGMEEIGEEEYLDSLSRQIEKYQRSLKAASDFERRQKLLRYFTGRGFEIELIREIVG